MSNRDENQSLKLAFSLHRSGQFDDAARVYRKIIKRNPRQPHALHSLGIIEASRGNFDEAAHLMARSLAVQATNLDFVQNYATVLCQLGQFEAARKVCLNGLEIDGTNVYLLYVLAGTLLNQSQLRESLSTFDKLLSIEPNHVAAITERSTVLLEMKQLDSAQADIDRALSLNPHFAEAHANRGILYVHSKRYDEAIASFDRALSLDPNSGNAWVGRATVFFELKRYAEAGAAFDKALSLQPRSAEAWLGSGNVFFVLEGPGEALAAYDRAISLQPNLPEAWLGRGNALFDLNRREEALAAYERALAFKPDSAEAWAGCGNVFSALRRCDEAFAAYTKAFLFEPNLVGVEGARLHAGLECCDWENLDVDCKKLSESIRSNHANATPFDFLALSYSAEDQLKCSQLWVERKVSQSALPLWRQRLRGHDKIRLGYVSADFRQHPVGYLAVGIFECHDRSQFEVLGISIGPDDNSELRRRLERSFDKFLDWTALGADQIAERIAAEEIDVLVDLNGFTQNARPRIFARRPAPVQVNYLGYAGSMGAACADYIIADPILIPASHQDSYTEKVAYLPHALLPHDTASRPISDRKFERANFGLPERGFVFCCFNNAYKLNPTVFRTQMKLLRAAAAQGIESERLIFAKRMPSLGDHLARHRLADLFLDTLPYNAHTSASDALWAGLPILTQIGQTFAGRVGASLLMALGLPELIVESADQFENLAIELATEPERLAAIKNKLARNRLATPLFNTTLYTRHLESLYSAMHRRWQDGLLPDHIHVPP